MMMPRTKVIKQRTGYIRWEDSGGVLKEELLGYAKGLRLQCETEEESKMEGKSWQ